MASKAKVHSGASKRFKKTGAGFKFKHAHTRPILTHLPPPRPRQLRGTSIVDAADVPRVKRLFRAI